MQLRLPKITWSDTQHWTCLSLQWAAGGGGDSGEDANDDKQEEQEECEENEKKKWSFLVPCDVLASVYKDIYDCSIAVSLYNVCARLYTII